MLKGVDISQWQGTIDHAEVARNVDFAMVRASYGTTIIDRLGWVYRTRLRHAGVLLGHYHYAAPDHSSGAIQARVFLDAVGWRIPGELLALDLEESHYDLAEWARNFAQVVLNVTGSAPLIYTNPDFLHRYDFTLLQELGCPLWLASWGTPADNFEAPAPWIRAVMHQYTNELSVPGFPALVDGDTFDGDPDKWRNLGMIQ